MMRRRTFGFVMAMLLGLNPADAAEKRIALVIANAAYEHLTALNNPTHDATAVGTVLAQAGFDVTNAANLSLADMRRRINEFEDRFGSSGPDTVALVFFAGRGVQVNGNVYLIPIGARLESASELWSGAISVSVMLDALTPKSGQMALFIFDCPRTIPFGSGNIVIIDPPNDTFVAFASAQGHEALDGIAATSPYATALVEAMKEPGLTIEQVFKNVRLAVHKATDGKQTPWETDALTRDFVFFPAK